MKKIPDHAKKVFEGIIFDVYHWDQEMFDGSTAIFEALKKRETAVAVAVTSDGMVVVNDEEQPMKEPFISLPGGMCEKDSIDPLEDSKRELKEETGYTSEDWSHWFIVDPLGHSKIVWNNNFYIAKNVKKTSEPKLDPGEKITTKLLAFEEFLELRNDSRFRNKEILEILKRAASSEEEKQKLKDLLGIGT